MRRWANHVIHVTKFVKLEENLNIDLGCNMFSFQESELTSEDIIEKNIGLYIHVNIDSIPIKKDSIDIGSNVNVCLVELLQKYFPSIYAK